MGAKLFFLTNFFLLRSYLSTSRLLKGVWCAQKGSYEPVPPVMKRWNSASVLMRLMTFSKIFLCCRFS